MQKIADFMMSKKFIPVALVLIAASFFLAFKSQGRTDTDDNPKSRHARILRNVGVLLEEGHFSPRKIDDAFSKTVLKKFTEDLDDEKDILLASDIESFKKYENKIDDEIHGSELESFYAINEVYLKRLNEASKIYQSILAKPFDFTVDESVQLEADKNNFPKDEA
ncbi:MAG: tail-specific protease, partial [Bacteroidetes bacterium]|nr:tail-specific protease [Bacteroidota bacterium]